MAVLLGSGLGACSGGAGGGCAITAPAPPYGLVGLPESVTAGQQLVVRGRFFNDAYALVDGCAPEPVPSEAVALRLSQAGRTWVLGTSDAAPDLTIAWSVSVPRDVSPGIATWTTSKLPDASGPNVLVRRALGTPPSR